LELITEKRQLIGRLLEVGEKKKRKKRESQN
jgi:hypothetical protein